MFNHFHGLPQTEGFVSWERQQGAERGDGEERSGVRKTKVSQIWFPYWAWLISVGFRERLSLYEGTENNCHSHNNKWASSDITDINPQI